MAALVLCTLLAAVVPSLSFHIPGATILAKHGPSNTGPIHKLSDRNLHVGRTRFAMRTGTHSKNEAPPPMLRSSIQFSAVTNLPEGVEASATRTLCRGRGRKGSLYFSNSWTVHSADHDWEARSSQISNFHSKGGTISTDSVLRTRMVLAGFVMMVASFPTVALLIKPVAGLNLGAKMFANALAGMTAISIIHPMESFFSARGGGKDHFNGIGDALAAQILLRSMTILSYTYFHSLISSAASSAAAAFHGLAGVALSSLATGIVMALVSAPLEAAADMDEKEGSLSCKLKKLAGRGVLGARGLYGTLRHSLVVNVVSFETFFLSYTAMTLLWPGVPASWVGTFMAGGIAGIASAASAAVVVNMGKVNSVRQRVRDWWRGRKCIRSDVQDVVDECYAAAGFNSVLFVSYKAVLKSLMVAM